MKKKKGNVVWNLFASVKLALFTLFTLAFASIIGTIIPQNQAPARYVEQYGESLARVFQILEIPDMYSSWWFTTLLILFSINLTICTIERFPHIWKVVKQDNLDTKTDRLEKMAQRRSFAASVPTAKAENAVQEIMAGAGWQLARSGREEGALFFAQKGAWTRLGVIFVHVSILVIFAGSLIGNFLGYKASVMISEGSFADKVYQTNDEHTPIPLGFKVICDAFYLTHYDTGAPKEFRSDLKVHEDGQEVYAKSIVVNDPMQYKGLTFYQSNYQAMSGQFVALVTNEATDKKMKFSLSPRRQVKWPEENITFGITNISGPDMMGRYRYKIWFSDAKAGPSEFWINEAAIARIQRPEATYAFTVKARYATGLQVVKDPGVWTVYIGCGMMIIGLIIIFFMSHRRIWVFVSKGPEASILVSGTSNKNKIGFEKEMSDLYEIFEDSKKL